MVATQHAEWLVRVSGVPAFRTEPNERNVDGGWPAVRVAVIGLDEVGEQFEALEAGKHVACTVPKRYLGVGPLPDAVR